MPEPMKKTEQALHDLLSEWGGALLRLQISMPASPALDGGILCPACGMIHGRCHEAVYPLLTLAARTGDGAYLAAAKKLFRWGENMLLPDGSLRNDRKSDWRGVTVFGAIALHDALYYHGALLSVGERRRWEARLSAMGAWLYANLLPGKINAYLNYYAANACAMALLGRYFENEAYAARAQALAAYCFSHVSERLLLCGEGHPTDVRTEKGCRAADPGGYNPEETLPCLTRYAFAAGDADARRRCTALWREQLRWMLPDGAWDNSMGSRAFKWTYWGSRTADGCQEALFLLGKEDPVFAAAAVRNLSLYRRCTHNGLLYGGPDYFDHGELPCVHHTFCRAKTLAGSLNGGVSDVSSVPLPADAPEGIVFYPELNAFRLSLGDWRADLCGYDYFPFPGAHVSGGTVSLLWHKKYGALIACGAPELTLREPFNQQLPSSPETHASLCPRLEAAAGGVRFAQYYDRRAVITAERRHGCLFASVRAALCAPDGAPMPGGACELEYELTEHAFRIRAKAPAKARFVLPLIGGASLTVQQGARLLPPRSIFSLNPGFEAQEYTVLPDQEGRLALCIG